MIARNDSILGRSRDTLRLDRPVASSTVATRFLQDAPIGSSLKVVGADKDDRWLADAILKEVHPEYLIIDRAPRTARIPFSAVLYWHFDVANRGQVVVVLR